MRNLFLIVIILTLFGCGTDFFLNKEPITQKVFLSQGDKSLELSARTMVEDNNLRTKLVSEFYRGYADVTYDNGKFHIKYANLPLQDEHVEYLKGDLYAAFYAGDYPFHSDTKMFGRAVFENSTKLVHDTDDYLLYRVTYNGTEIRVINLVREYTLLIQSAVPIGKPR